MTPSGGNSLLQLLSCTCKQTSDLSFWMGFSDVHLWHLFQVPCRYVMHWYQNILLDFQSSLYWHRLWIVNYAERQESGQNAHARTHDTRRTTQTHARYSQENTQLRAILGENTPRHDTRRTTHTHARFSEDNLHPRAVLAGQRTPTRDTRRTRERREVPRTPRLARVRVFAHPLVSRQE